MMATSLSDEGNEDGIQSLLETVTGGDDKNT